MPFGQSPRKRKARGMFMDDNTSSNVIDVQTLQHKVSLSFSWFFSKLKSNERDDSVTPVPESFTSDQGNEGAYISYIQ